MPMIKAANGVPMMYTHIAWSADTCPRHFSPRYMRLTANAHEKRMTRQQTINIERHSIVKALRIISTMLIYNKSAGG